MWFFDLHQVANMEQFSTFFHRLGKVFRHVANWSRDGQVSERATEKLRNFDVCMKACVMEVRNTRVRKLEAPADRVPVLMSLTVDIDSGYCSGLPLELCQKCNVDWQVKTLGTAACRKADALD